MEYGAAYPNVHNRKSCKYRAADGSMTNRGHDMPSPPQKKTLICTVSPRAIFLEENWIFFIKVVFNNSCQLIYNLL